MALVKHIAYITPSNGEIKRIQLSSAEIPDEGINAEGLYVKHMYDALPDPAYFIETNYYDSQTDSWLSRPEAPNGLATWNGTSWEWTDENFWKLVRLKRDPLLKETDWVVLPDSPVAEPEKNETRFYRYMLRDITFQAVPASGRVEDLVWPSKPTFL